jgi:hypothetical protein
VFAFNLRLSSELFDTRVLFGTEYATQSEMGEQGDKTALPPWLRLPDSVARSGDPVEANPFGPGDPRHQVWADAARVADERICQIRSQAFQSLTPDTAETWLADLAAKQFDVWVLANPTVDPAVALTLM